MSPRLSDLARSPLPRKAPPRTVKGRDIELYASDGQRVETDAQRAFTRPTTPDPTLPDRLKGLDKPVSWFAEQWKKRRQK